MNLFSLSAIHGRMNREKTYDCTSYKKRPHDSQYGSSPPINAWCSSTHCYSRW
ncbi:hypothetical protein HYC85_019004 [Camellia sinensis]|uniref:Uncharacterized protein n=1 Tax=Camellia sinensis TaxID=4442 RepID=A0A7J7GWU5_CAMSI|nr:hypothetical protein HYC85_019004 [Camellia sinensis]